MELVTDEDGVVAPRLNDISMSAEQAIEDHAVMMDYVKLMLCAGLVHGDLSEFNVLVDDYGPVIIDLPQAVFAAANNNAQKMLYRDVQNMTVYYSQYAPELMETRYAQEIWALFEDGELYPYTELTGEYADDGEHADVDSVLEEINAVKEEQEALQRRKREAEEDDEL
jgi:RIO kinase 1